MGTIDQDFDKYDRVLDGKNTGENTFGIDEDFNFGNYVLTSKDEDEKQETENVDTSIDNGFEEKQNEAINADEYQEKQQEEKREEEIRKEYEEMMKKHMDSLDEETKQSIKTYKQKLEKQRIREQSQEYKEQVAKRKELFSPKVEKLYMGYMLLRGYVTEEQAKEYLREAIPDGSDEDRTPVDFNEVLRQEQEQQKKK